MMLRAELCVRTLSGFCLSSSSSSSCTHHHSNLMSIIIPNSSSSLSSSSPFSLHFLTFPPSFNYNHTITNKVVKHPLISCTMQSHSHDHGSFDPQSRHHHPPHDDFLQASLLFSETVKHHHLRKQGFQEEVKQLSGQFVPFSAQVKDFKAHVNSIGPAILRCFQNPTIFLKVSCEGDFLLPIIVGEHAVEDLINSVEENSNEEYSNHFQFVRNIVAELGYEVKMVKITTGVVNTYFARVYFGKVGERSSFSVDAHPSDAINVAKRCKVESLFVDWNFSCLPAPIYVNKQIVLTDAIRIAYGTGRVRDTKPVYDVLLDSPMEPDLLVEEFNLVQNMKLAVKEERYIDAAMWRDKVTKLQDSGL